MSARSRWGWAAAAVFFAAANAAASPPAARHDALPIEGLVANPDWISKPSGEDVSRFYPPLPQMLGLSGRALMSCRVSALGILEGCTVGAEIPAGMGFGRATLLLAPYFHMRPMSLDGAPVGGAQVNIPVRFQFADEDTAAVESPHLPPPSEKALALARILVSAALIGPAVEKQINAMLVGIKQQLTEVDADALATPQGQAALAALRQAFERGASSHLERAATSFAQTLTESQMSQAVAFMQSPAGKALTNARESLSDNVGANRGWAAAVRKDALTQFCAMIACLPETRPASPTPSTQGLKP